MKSKFILHPAMLAAIVLLPLAAFAQKRPGESVTVQTVALQGTPKPGSSVTAVVTFQIEKGYHTHSHQPSEPNFIPTVLTLPAAAGIKAGTIEYTPGKSLKVEGLEKPVSIYEDHFEVKIPLQLESSAKLPAILPATLRYQSCQGALCYPPRTLKFDLKVAAP